MPGNKPTATIPRNEACGSLATTTPLTGYEPNVSDNFDDIEVTASIFQTSINDLGDNGTESPDAEIDDEHIRNALASPLYFQKREANASLLQAYHSNEDSLLPGARSVLAGTGEPVAWLSQTRKCGQELDDLSNQEPSGKTEGTIARRSKIRKPEADSHIRELNRQIGSQALEIGHTFTEYEQSRREQDLLHEELADRERALREARIWSVHEMEELKRAQELQVDEFSTGKSDRKLKHYK